MEVFDLLAGVYNAFNARDVDRVLAAVHPEVDWPNGMEGGYVHGHAAVRDYWTRQWRSIRTSSHGASPSRAMGASPSMSIRSYETCRGAS